MPRFQLMDDIQLQDLIDSADSKNTKYAVISSCTKVTVRVQCKRVWYSLFYWSTACWISYCTQVIVGVNIHDFKEMET